MRTYLCNFIVHVKLIFLIKFQEYFEKMYSCSGAFKDPILFGTRSH